MFTTHWTLPGDEVGWAGVALSVENHVGAARLQRNTATQTIDSSFPGLF